MHYLRFPCSYLSTPPSARSDLNIKWLVPLCAPLSRLSLSPFVHTLDPTPARPARHAHGRVSAGSSVGVAPNANLSGKSVGCLLPFQRGRKRNLTWLWSLSGPGGQSPEVSGHRFGEFRPKRRLRVRARYGNGLHQQSKGSGHAY